MAGAAKVGFGLPVAAAQSTPPERVSREFREALVENGLASAATMRGVPVDTRDFSVGSAIEADKEAAPEESTLAAGGDHELVGKGTEPIANFKDPLQPVAGGAKAERPANALRGALAGKLGSTLPAVQAMRLGLSDAAKKISKAPIATKEPVAEANAIFGSRSSLIDAAFLQVAPRVAAQGAELSDGAVCGSLALTARSTNPEKSDVGSGLLERGLDAQGETGIFTRPSIADSAAHDEGRSVKAKGAPVDLVRSPWPQQVQETIPSQTPTLAVPATPVEPSNVAQAPAKEKGLGETLAATAHATPTELEPIGRGLVANVPTPHLAGGLSAGDAAATTSTRESSRIPTLAPAEPAEQLDGPVSPVDDQRSTQENSLVEASASDAGAATGQTPGIAEPSKGTISVARAGVAATGASAGKKAAPAKVDAGVPLSATSQAPPETKITPDQMASAPLLPKPEPHIAAVGATALVVEQAVHTPATVPAPTGSAHSTATAKPSVEEPAALPQVGDARTLSATPQVLEVGVASGTHGWLRVRAEMGASGEVAASVVAASFGVAQALHREMPALQEYLSREQVPVSSVAVATVAQEGSAGGASGQRNSREQATPQDQPEPGRNAVEPWYGTSANAWLGPAETPLLVGQSGGGSWVNVRV